jgi:hypothetical protein
MSNRRTQKNKAEEQVIDALALVSAWTGSLTRGALTTSKRVFLPYKLSVMPLCADSLQFVLYPWSMPRITHGKSMGIAGSLGGVGVDCP